MFLSICCSRLTPEVISWAHNQRLLALGLGLHLPCHSRAPRPTNPLSCSPYLVKPSAALTPNLSTGHRAVEVQQQAPLRDRA